MKILVVEDDLHIQRLVRETLEADGHQIVATADGNEAARWMSQSTFRSRRAGFDGAGTDRF